MNDFARDDELKTRGNRVGPWSLVKTSVLDQKRMCVCAVHSLMSALGHKRTCAVQNVMTALPQKADIRERTLRVRKRRFNRLLLASSRAMIFCVGHRILLPDHSGRSF